MAYALKKDREIEYWMKPFIGRVRMSGYKSRLFENTRLFFDLYWQLLNLGCTEQQIADHAVMWGARSQLPGEIALAQAVFDLAERQGLECSEMFIPFVDAT